ncbi:hypothetical protein C1H46_040403 [Malus baccata]|uniref:FF domain-containing protein n=1 Tax=Malus baccata TaxID=106549 RepID=A0A540KJ62_MALBA|nr:hypothetical protein C1H46_040403 [Malus baccata]
MFKWLYHQDHLPHLSLEENPSGGQTPVVASSSTVMESTEVVVTINDTGSEPMEYFNNLSAQDFDSCADGVPIQESEEATDGVTGKKITDIAMEEKSVDREPITHENKLFINDKRHDALKTLGERKQAFNEECSELMSSTRWGSAFPGESIFENDEHFKVVEQDRDRREMSKDYVEELQKKERAKVQEERKRNVLEYRRFLESCDFIKVKDLPAYLAVASNTSGATPKDLFDDVVKELTKQVIKIYLAFLIILILIYMKWDL